jgi:hypothetical protein
MGANSGLDRAVTQLEKGKAVHRHFIRRRSRLADVAAAHEATYGTKERDHDEDDYARTDRQQPARRSNADSQHCMP